MDLPCSCATCELLDSQKQILGRLIAIESLLKERPELRSHELRSHMEPREHTTTRRLLTVREVAADLGLCESAVRLWIARRRIEAVHLGRSVRIPTTEIERLIREGLTPLRRR
jgi:excisionase family DNA binding protein